MADVETGAAQPSAIPTRCYLVRHCDVENPRRVIYGHLPGFGLSSRGIDQAQALGRFFRNTPVRIILASPLQRAQETARIIQAHLQDVPVVTTHDLVEAEFGRYLQGVPQTQIVWRRPRWWVHMLCPGLLPGDESMAAMARRERRALDRVIDLAPGAGGICISHGDPIQAFWATADGRPPWALHRLQCAKGGLLTLDYTGHHLVQKKYHSPDRIARLVANRPA